MKMLKNPLVQTALVVGGVLVLPTRVGMVLKSSIADSEGVVNGSLLTHF